MNYCKEFFEWTNTEGEYNFSIKEISSSMFPGDRKDISCDGIGFKSLYKDNDGTLTLEINGEFKKFFEVKAGFLNNH